MAKPGAHFVLTQNGRRSRKVALHRFPFQIGRDKGCALVIDDPLVSPLHAVVEQHRDTYRLTNRSVNGTRT